ncbi:MAG TPA: ATP-binding protein [Candidatus Eremiobacteraceae bacterium]|nr:ATP-binding protein [Candidatus Eremiobacteraceae bacterium]
MPEPLKKAVEADGSPAVARLSFPARPQWVGVARLATAAIASRLDFSIDELEDLKLAVAEASTICITANGGGDVAIECTLADDRIVIAVTRSGAKPARRAPDQGEADLSGLGVFLIRALMDDVSYESDHRGTRLRLTKLLRK